ncbi:MAG: hypothetical protein AVO35_09590 [Candidatus Aegiribacteria sp. MLS_C]|nr:MAG: hypothetical protein AVO35_09590 [Candidatus Aegiribacteria sp. MLS_C]
MLTSLLCGTDLMCARMIHVYDYIIPTINLVNSGLSAKLILRFKIVVTTVWFAIIITSAWIIKLIYRIKVTTASASYSFVNK